MSSPYSAIAPGGYSAANSAALAAQSQFNAILSTLSNLLTLMTSGTATVSVPEIRYSIITEGTSTGGETTDGQTALQSDIDGILKNYESTYTTSGTGNGSTVSFTPAGGSGVTLTKFSSANTTVSSNVVSGLAGFSGSGTGAPAVGKRIAGTNIPAGATITSVTNATTVVISANATDTNAATATVIVAVS